MLKTTIGIAALICMTATARAAPSETACAQRNNDTPAKLLECVRQQDLWRYLSAFQKIADDNPGADGHGNRNTGTPGYRASVAYVAGLMTAAGYRVTIQQYDWEHTKVLGTPVLEVAGTRYVFGQDWFAAGLTVGGSVTAKIVAAGDARFADSASGCAPTDFPGFPRGAMALLKRGPCDYDAQVQNAQAAGASAVIIYNGGRTAQQDMRGPGRNGAAFEAELSQAPEIPVIGVVSRAAGENLLQRAPAGGTAHLDVRTQRVSDIDYNVIADSPYGDPSHVVVVDAHLDAIFGAGMLDNASGSATILDIALNLAHTGTRNQLRYI